MKSKINDKTEKITNRQWYFLYVKNSEFDGIAHYYDNSDKEDLIFCRLFEIFNVTSLSVVGYRLLYGSSA